MSTAARVSWAVTIVLGSVGLLYVPIVTLPLFPLFGAVIYVATRRHRIASIVVPPALLFLYPLAHLAVPEAFFDNWNFLDPNPVEYSLAWLTPMEFMSYYDPYWAGLVFPISILATPLLLCAAVLVAVLRRIQP